jgi:hypothetical protein
MRGCNPIKLAAIQRHFRESAWLENSSPTPLVPDEPTLALGLACSFDRH